jgi:anti-sigma regulatory factor (Ser/Thr protein kinase)
MNTFTVQGERDLARARRYVLDRCQDSGLPLLCEDAALLASELVANAIQHAGGPIEVRAERDNGHLVVQVADGSSETPRVQRPDPWTERGRGMAMVEAVARDWGVSSHPAGKVVWFRI